MELEAQELFWLYRSFGLAGAGINLADAEHRFKIRSLLEFTAEEKEAIEYREIARPDGTWSFQFQSRGILAREFTERQIQKMGAVVGEVVPLLKGDDYVSLRRGLVKIGWRPPEEEADD